MTTDLALPGTMRIRDARRRVAPTLAVGLAGGLSLGIVARAWMRLIAEEPAFTWGGTIFIVLGFTIFGLTQSVVAIATGRARRRWTLTIARLIGTVGLMPLFVAAGGLMLPTVIGGGFASARREWRLLARGACAAVASAPVLLVGHDLVQSFGWSLHTIAGFTAMLAVYSTIVWTARFTFAARPDGARLPRWARITGFVVLGLVLAFFAAGAIFTKD